MKSLKSLFSQVGFFLKVVDTIFRKKRVTLRSILNSLDIDSSKFGVLVKAGFDPLASYDDVLDKELILSFEKEEDC